MKVVRIISILVVGCYVHADTYSYGLSIDNKGARSARYPLYYINGLSYIAQSLTAPAAARLIIDVLSNLPWEATATTNILYNTTSL